MFNIGDNISHPMHGAGSIIDIIDRNVNNQIKTFYLVKIISGSMTVLVPCELCDAIGIRHIISAKEAYRIIDSIHDLTTTYNDNWSKRYQENIDKIKTGDLFNVATVYKTLFLRDRVKNLSTGERKILSMSKNILISELALATGCSISEIEQKVIKNII